MSKSIQKTNFVLKIASKNYKLKRKRLRFVVVSSDGRKTEIASNRVLGIILYKSGIVTTSALALATQKKIPMVSFYNSDMLLFQPPSLYIKPDLLKAQVQLPTQKLQSIASKIAYAYATNICTTFEKLFNIKTEHLAQELKKNLPDYPFLVISEIDSELSKMIPSEILKINPFPLFQTLKTLFSHHVTIFVLKAGLSPDIAFIHYEKHTSAPLSLDITLEFAPTAIFPLVCDLVKKYNSDQIPFQTLLKAINNLMQTKFNHTNLKKTLPLQKIIDMQIKSLTKTISIPTALYNPVTLEAHGHA